MKTLIVGGVAGGMSAATRLRRLDEQAEIVVFERGQYVSFANCGLPYYVGGVIENRSELLLQTPESLTSRFRLDVRINHEVTSIDRAARTVTVRNPLTGVFSTETYDRLILAAGASARIARAGLTISTLRTVDDVDYIESVLSAKPDDATAVVIGAGFIGLEAVENLVHRGVHVTLVQRNLQLFTPLDPEMAAPLTALLREHGVDVRVGTTVLGASATGLGLELSDGTTVPADLVIDASGVSPDASLAEQAGLRIGATGGVWVDSRQCTSDPFIYAVGDGVEKTDAVSGDPLLVTMAGLANGHGRAAADSIAGQSEPAAPALGTSILGLFGVTISLTGWSEKRLVAAGRAHRIAHTHPGSHAGYYPGSESMSMKLLIDPVTDAILGAQIVGGSGVDKRMDVIVTAMAGGLTASALTRLELAYAPQFSSAKDPVNQLGYVADNLRTGTSRNIQWHELAAARAAGAVLVDVRNSGEFEAGTVDGAINVPLDDLRTRLSDLPNAPLIVHCQVGQRGHTAARILAQHGFDVRNLDGGYRTWLAGASLTPAHTTPERILA